MISGLKTTYITIPKLSRPINNAPTKFYYGIKALEVDVSDTESKIAIAGSLLGVILGLGAPIFYSSRDEADEKRLNEIRSLNRATKEATGKFMKEEKNYRDASSKMDRQTRVCG